MTTIKLKGRYGWICVTSVTSLAEITEDYDLEIPVTDKGHPIICFEPFGEEGNDEICINADACSVNIR